MGSEVAVGNLKKTYLSDTGEAVVAIRNIDLVVGAGRFCVLVGDSGSGKTTLLRSIAGLETPDAGEIKLGERTVFSSSKRIVIPPDGRRIGMVFQSYAIWPHMTVLENVTTPLIHGRQRLKHEEARKRGCSALEIVGLQCFIDRPAPLLSGGQQQRVALARAIAVSSDLLLMDEPMSNLDARLREEVRNQIRTIVSQYGTTVIYVTHDQQEALSLADEIALMRDGRILQHGTPTELYDGSLNREIAEFFGPMNIVQGELIADDLVRISIGTVQIVRQGHMRGRVLIGIRPERIRLMHTSNQNGFAGVVTERIYLGSLKIYRVEISGLALRVDSTSQYNVGEAVTVVLERESVRLFDPAGTALRAASLDNRTAVASVVS